MKSTIELLDFELEVDIGTYQDDIIITKHIIDLTLTINPNLVIVEKDKMDDVFDYDPLIQGIIALTREQDDDSKVYRRAHYETQERLITLIVKECSAYDKIHELDLFLHKSPISRPKNGDGNDSRFTGKLGVRIVFDERDLNKFRLEIDSES